MKLNVYLRENLGISRKAADRLISSGKVKVNGETQKPAFKVGHHDSVDVDDSSLPDKVYLAYNKPRGLITQTSGDMDSVVNRFAPKGLFPIGRLDKDSDGLLIVTNDGRLSTWLLDPSKHHEKTYRVVTREPIRSGAVNIFAAGMRTQKYGKLKPVRSKVLSKNEIEMVLTEGKNHQIRIMLAELSLTVESLRRVKIMNIALGGLAPGKTRIITQPEVGKLIHDLS